MREGLRITERGYRSRPSSPRARRPPDRPDRHVPPYDLRGRRRRQHPRPHLADHARPHGGRALDDDRRPRLPVAVDRTRARRGRRPVGRPGISYAGFHSDFGRTWVVGREPDARQRAQFDKWIAIMDAVLEVTRAGATAADLTAAAIEAAGGIKPWMPHFYLGHGLGIDSAESPYVGSDIGEAFDASLVLAAGNGAGDRAHRLGRRSGGLPLRGGPAHHRGRLGAHDRLPLRSVLRTVTSTEVRPTISRCGWPAGRACPRRNGRSRHRRARRWSGRQRPLCLGRTAALDRRLAGVRSRLRARAGDRFGAPLQHLGRGHPRGDPAREPLRDLVQRGAISSRSCRGSRVPRPSERSPPTA